MNQQLIEIKEALKAATPGPWGYQNMGGKNTPIVYDIKNEDIICTSADEYNGKLIANAPEWLASLVSGVERLMQEKEVAFVESERLVQAEEQVEEMQKTIETAFNIACEEFETVNQLELVRATLGATLQSLKGEDKHETNS